MFAWMPVEPPVMLPAGSRFVIGEPINGVFSTDERGKLRGYLAVGGKVVYDNREDPVALEIRALRLFDKTLLSRPFGGRLPMQGTEAQ